MQIPFLAPAYLGRSVDINTSRSINLFLEPSQGRSKSEMALVGTPGTSLWQYIGTSPIRGMYRFGDYLFVVSGTGLYRVGPSNNVVSVGSLNTSVGPVEFTDNGIAAQGVGGNQLVIIDYTYGYIYNLLDNSLVTHPSPNFPQPVKSVTYMDGYIIATGGNMGITVSELYDASTYNGLAIAAAIANPDNIQRLINLHQQLFVIKEFSTEIWYNTGTATQDGCPFARVQGAVIDYGTVAPLSVARGNNSVFFLANQRIGDGTGALCGVVQLDGYTPTVVSPPSITYRISKLSSIKDAQAFCYVDEGHTFYQITFPSDDVTLVYDALTQSWHERSTYTTPSEVVFSNTGTPTPKATLPTRINRHLASCYTNFQNKHLIGDYRIGNVYHLSSDYYSDNGEPIISECIAPVIYDTNESNAVSITKLTVDAEVGVGDGGYDLNPYGIGYLADGDILADGISYAGATLEISTSGDPYYRLSWSDDNGHTWSSEYEAAAGKIGEFSTRLVWWRLGMAYRRVFKLKISAAVKRIINMVTVEGAVG